MKGWTKFWLVWFVLAIVAGIMFVVGLSAPGEQAIADYVGSLIICFLLGLPSSLVVLLLLALADVFANVSAQLGAVWLIGAPIAFLAAGAAQWAWLQRWVSAKSPPSS